MLAVERDTIVSHPFGSSKMATSSYRAVKLQTVVS